MKKVLMATWDDSDESPNDEEQAKIVLMDDVDSNLTRYELNNVINDFLNKNNNITLNLKLLGK